MAKCKNAYTDYESQLGNHSVLKITTSRKKVFKVVVDTDMVERLKQHRWFVNQRDQRIYNEDNVNIRHIIYGEPKEGCIITTINRDYLDNRRENLTEVSGHAELSTKNTIYANNRTGIKGVCETKYHYIAHIKRGHDVRRVKFCKNKLGLHEARKQAIQQRKLWEDELD